MRAEGSDIRDLEIGTKPLPSISSFLLSVGNMFEVLHLNVGASA
jgi:hypothetical protein